MPYKDREKQRESQRLSSRRRTLVYKAEAVRILGGKCSRCPITDIRVLHIDHIVPMLRPRGSNSGTNNAILVVKGILTSDLVQLLCANCHAIKTYEEDRKLYKNYCK